MMCASARVNRSVCTENHEQIIPKHGVVTVFGYGSSVRTDRGHLVIEDGIAEERRFGRFARVNHGIKRVVVIGSDGMVSLSALRWLATQEAAFVLLDRLGKVIATTGPVNSYDARLRRAQSSAHESGIAVSIAKELINQKLIAQQRLVLRDFQNSEAAFGIVSARNGLSEAVSTTEILKYEAFGASAYWSAWRGLEINFPRVDLPRVPEHWKKFGSRMSPLTASPRMAINPANAILNYLYALLESESRLALAALGLDPGIGVLHADTRNRDSLACDLMEPVRPQVDAYALNWIRKSPFRRQWFLEDAIGNCRLSSSIASQLSETSEIWRRAVAPFAEGIAKALWSMTSKPERKEPPATRLTQDRMPEVEGFEIQEVKRRAAEQPTNCRTCGASVKSGQKYCRGCAPDASREQIQRASVLGRLNTHSPSAQARRAATISRQNAAIKAWNPIDNPSWLNEAAYRSRIQPRLAKILVPNIMSLLSVCEPYALRIRNGKCIPHPRHWMALAKICEVSE